MGLRPKPSSTNHLGFKKCWTWGVLLFWYLSSPRSVGPLYSLSLMLIGGSRDEATSKRINKWIFHRSLGEEGSLLLHGSDTPLCTKCFAAMSSVLFLERTASGPSHRANEEDCQSFRAFWETDELTWGLCTSRVLNISARSWKIRFLFLTFEIDYSVMFGVFWLSSTLA